MKRLVAPLRLRSSTGAERGRKVTWLELFFDLIFVAAVAQVAAPLRDDYSVMEIVRFTPLFALIWWAWTGNTVFSTRFDTDDVVQRIVTLIQMFAVAAMAANAKDALDSRSSAGFAAAYAVVRLVLVSQYVRARRVREARSLASRYVAGHGAAALIWLASALVPAPIRFALWAIAFAIDLGTPWLSVRHSVKAPPDAAHLPERFGLFTLILLGESVVAVMQGMESQTEWTATAAASAFLGMGIAFVTWSWYFDGIAGASEQPVRSRREAIRFHIWSYAHFPLYLGIVVTGVGVHTIITAASRAAVSAAEATILICAAVVVMLAMTAIGATSSGHARQPSAASKNVVLSIVTLTVGLLVGTDSPLALLVTIAGFSAAQLVVSSQARRFVRPEDKLDLYSRADGEPSVRPRSLRHVEGSNRLETEPLTLDQA